MQATFRTKNAEGTKSIVLAALILATSGNGHAFIQLNNLYFYEYFNRKEVVEFRIQSKVNERVLFQKNQSLSLMGGDFDVKDCPRFQFDLYSLLELNTKILWHLDKTCLITNQLFIVKYRSKFKNSLKKELDFWQK